MKAFIAAPFLFAAAALAAPEPSWSFTFTFSDASSTWESATVATAAPNATVTTAPSSAWTGPTEWISTTSYTATYSAGNSTWGVPTAVSYSCGESWTSMIPAPTAAASTSKANGTTSAATITATTSGAFGFSSASTTASAAATSFTGAAAPNVNGQMAGLGAIAMAGLALVL